MVSMYAAHGEHEHISSPQQCIKCFSDFHSFSILGSKLADKNWFSLLCRMKKQQLTFLICKLLVPFTFFKRSVALAMCPLSRSNDARLFHALATYRTARVISHCKPIYMYYAHKSPPEGDPLQMLQPSRAALPSKAQQLPE